MEKKLRTKDPQALIHFPLMEQALTLLREGKPARLIQCAPEHQEDLRQLQLITTKPVLYVCNVPEEEALKGNQFTEKVKERGGRMALISAAVRAPGITKTWPVSLLQSILAPCGRTTTVQARQ